MNSKAKQINILCEQVRILAPDQKKEIIRLEDKIKDYEGRMNSVKKKIDNKNFIKRAPKQIVQHEKDKYLDYKNNFDKLKNNLDNLLS